MIQCKFKLPCGTCGCHIGQRRSNWSCPGILCSVKHVCVCAKLLWLCLTVYDPVNCSRQAPLSMRFPRQEYWSGLPFPLPGDLPNPGIQPGSLALAGGFFATEPLGKPRSVKNPPHFDYRS